MTEQEFLDRCKVAYRAGLGRPQIAHLMAVWLDAVMRMEHSMFGYGQTQGRDWLRFLNDEYERTEFGERTLANDADGYALQRIAAIFTHSCQQCATDPEAWHTRPGLCPHKRAKP